MATTLISKVDAGSRIIGMMAATTAFGVIGAEIRNAKTPRTAPADKIGLALADPFLIVLGGTIATAILVGFAEFGGEVGQKVGTGLAGLALLTTVLVSGGPVWIAIGNVFTAGPDVTAKTGKTAKGADTYGGGGTPGPVASTRGAS